MIHYQDKDFSQIYEAILHDLAYSPEYITKPRDMVIKENCDVSIVLEDPTSCLYTNPLRSSQFKYIAAEFLWYFMGRNDVAWISKYAKFWEHIQNPNGTVHSSYGNLLFTNKNEHGYSQYEWAHQSLVKDKDTRQAVLHFNLPMHQSFENKDFVCTMYGIFQIRENKLNFTVHMRSNDVILGLPTDIAFFAVLQMQMLNHLKITYPDLELGTYTHIANSLHVYERHFELVENMLAHPFKPETMPKVRQNLITLDGRPTADFELLFKSEALSKIEFKMCYVGEDNLYKWIKNNLV
jgi:thymidylate synthase